MPGDVKQSFFVASGTEADEMAVMLAMSHTGRSGVIGLGLMQAMEIVVDETAGNRTPDAALTGRIFEAARAAGLIIGKGGRWGNVFRVAPPMRIDEGQIDDGLAILAGALETAKAR
jgi:4-aminobutyrate aminotransferase-like enzyme